MKKVMIINTVYSYGGAAKVAREIFKYLNSFDKFRVYFAYGRGDKSSNELLFKFSNRFEFYLHAFLVRFLGIEGYGTYFSTKKLINFINKEKFDLVHVHNLHGYYLDFFKLIKFLGESKIPIIWTLHDEWPLTWMPAHSMGCSHCKNLEGLCTNSYSYPKTYNKLFASYLLKKKREFFSKKWKPVIVCPSRWLQKELRRSYLSNCDTRLINNGVDINVFKPYANKEELRKKYNLPLNKKIVLFSISNKKDSSKGYKYILEVSRRLRDKEVLFLGIGDPRMNSTGNLKSLGFIFDEKSLVEIYNLSDVLLYTSLAETMPLTVIEAMASGLPIVAFSVNALGELITDSDCGFLVDSENLLELENNLRLLLFHKEIRNRMSKVAREKAVNNFSLDKTLKDYYNLYNEILEK